MPRIRVFKMWRGADRRAWRTWRARVASHEIGVPCKARGRGAVGREFYGRVDGSYKAHLHAWDKRTRLLGRRNWPPHKLALFWADDHYWAILPTLTKSAKE